MPDGPLDSGLPPEVLVIHLFGWPGLWMYRGGVDESENPTGAVIGTTSTASAAVVQRIRDPLTGFAEKTLPG